MKRGIASQLFFAFSGIIILTISVLGLVLIYFTNQYFGNENMQSLMKGAQSAIEAINRYIVSDEVSTDDLLYNFDIIADNTNSIIHLINNESTYIVCTDIAECELDIQEETGVSFLKELDDNHVTVDIGALEFFNEMNKFSVRYSLYDEMENHIGYIEVIGRTNAILAFVDTLSAIFVLSALVILIIASVLSFFLTSRIVTPITKISDAAKSFTTGDFSARVDAVKGVRETQQLSETFNIMASAVQNHEGSLSNFVANVSHELRTPMTSIKGFVDGILDGTIEEKNQKKYLKIVSDEVGRLARLSDGMLQMSKLEAGEYVINADYYNIWDTITAVVIGKEKDISDKKIKVIGFMPKKINVFTDADIAHQIVYNIFDNAVKFTPENGKITIKVCEDKSGEYALFRVRNDGVGIPSEELPYIFDRFYKSDKSRSANNKGAGIGLYIVHTLLQRTGGKIEVESIANEYTEFLIYFPTKAIHILPTKNETIKK